MGGCESLVDQLQGASVSYMEVTTLGPSGLVEKVDGTGSRANYS